MTERQRSAATPLDPPLVLVGTDYRASPIELRERLSYTPVESEEVLVHLLARREIAEAALLSTCNRTEVYVVPRDDAAAYRAALAAVFVGRAPASAEPGRIYVKRNGEAARHLLAVASGLASMVLGEPEILGQVRQAAQVAEQVGAAGTLLRRLLKTAVAAGGRARAETAIAQGAVSLGYAVVELARNIFTGLDRTRVLVVGAGETAQLVARSLVERGAAEVRVANRTPARAEALRRELPAVELAPFDDLPGAIESADVVVTTTSAAEPILTAHQLAEALRRRPARPLLVVDLGVPRNVEPAVGRLESVFLHGIDALETLIERNLKRRREEVPRVEELIEEELARFRAWYRALEAEPLVARLQKQAEGIRRREVEGALHRFPAELHEEVDRLTRSLVRKILHHPSTRLRAKGGEERLPRLDLVRELFRLDDGGEGDGGDGPGGRGGAVESADPAGES
jgi:glutamyl-tRNA reductase